MFSEVFQYKCGEPFVNEIQHVSLFTRVWIGLCVPGRHLEEERRYLFQDSLCEKLATLVYKWEQLAILC